MKAVAKATRRAARAAMEREGLLYIRPELTGRNCITMGPPTAVLLPDFR
jgi:hypothetical protein